MAHSARSRRKAFTHSLRARGGVGALHGLTVRPASQSNQMTGIMAVSQRWSAHRRRWPRSSQPSRPLPDEQRSEGQQSEGRWSTSNEQRSTVRGSTSKRATANGQRLNDQRATSQRSEAQAQRANEQRPTVRGSTINEQRPTVRGRWGLGLGGKTMDCRLADGRRLSPHCGGAVGGHGRGCGGPLSWPPPTAPWAAATEHSWPPPTVPCGPPAVLVFPPPTDECAPVAPLDCPPAQTLCSPTHGLLKHVLAARAPTGGCMFSAKAL